MLLGRERECAVIDELLAGVSAGRAGVLVVHGEAGIGKSTLLGYAAEQAARMQVLRVRGVHAEARLAFAGLHAALRSVLAGLDRLPPPQAKALGSALGFVEATGDSPFLVSAGVVGLLAEAAESRPVLCLVDDAQWVDRASLEVLAFAARRFEADRVGMLFAVRSHEGDAEPIAGFPELALGPIDPVAAEKLIAQYAGGLHDPAVTQWLLAAAQGNPLALVELAVQLTEGSERTGGPGTGAAQLPLTKRLEEAFLRRVRDLPEVTQRLLLVAAADDAGDVGSLLAAAEALGAGRAALADAERAGLLQVRAGRVDFAHPLIRSAVYHSAPFTERQDVHRALADVLPGEESAARRLWHRAAAAVFPDEVVAGELEEAGRKARARGGHDAAAAALARAAALTADPSWATLLLLEAAAAAWESGSGTVTGLLDQAARTAPTTLLQARVDELRGRFEARRGVVVDGYEILVDAAGRIAPADPPRAAAMLVDAVRAASFAGDVARVIAAGRLAEQLPAPDVPPPEMAFVAGVAAVLSGQAARGVPLLRAAMSEAEGADDPALLLWAATGAAYLGDAPAWYRYAAQAVARARATGALGTLATALEALASIECFNNPAAAEADAAEGLRLARETHQPPFAANHLALLAWVAALRGDEAETEANAQEALELAGRHGLGFASTRASAALALLDVGLGRLPAAASRLVDLAASGHRGVVLGSTADLVEVAVRLGDAELARPAFERFDQWATASNLPSVLALRARCRALLSSGDRAEAFFTEALAHHAAVGTSVDSARTQLLFGEFLRRERRRVDARPHLRAALDAFDRLGARPWAERAHTELRASGETARRRDVDTADALTPQERQIARFAATGSTNKEIAAQLFLSPRTIDHHLRNVFSKLGITSRNQLRRYDLDRQM